MIRAGAQVDLGLKVSFDCCPRRAGSAEERAPQPLLPEVVLWEKVFRRPRAKKIRGDVEGRGWHLTFRLTGGKATLALRSLGAMTAVALYEGTGSPQLR